MFWRVLYDFQVGPHKGTFYKTVSYIKNIENVPLRGPKKILFKILFLQFYSFNNYYLYSLWSPSDKFVDSYCSRTYESSFFFVPLQEQALT